MFNPLTPQQAQNKVALLYYGPTYFRHALWACWACTNRTVTVDIGYLGKTCYQSSSICLGHGIQDCRQLYAKKCHTAKGAHVLWTHSCYSCYLSTYRSIIIAATLASSIHVLEVRNYDIQYYYTYIRASWFHSGELLSMVSVTYCSFPKPNTTDAWHVSIMGKREKSLYKAIIHIRTPNWLILPPFLLLCKLLAANTAHKQTQERNKGHFIFTTPYSI